MNRSISNGDELFKAIINDPSILRKLPINYQYDLDFLHLFYIILDEKIKPYIPVEIFNMLKHREIIFKNHIKHQPSSTPNITLKDELEILHDILTNPKAIENLPTDEKYNSDFLEFIYIIWEEQIKPYIPYEMFEQLQNEALMKKYHNNYEQEYEKWAKEEHQKVLIKDKNCYQ